MDEMVVVDELCTTTEVVEYLAKRSGWTSLLLVH